MEMNRKQNIAVMFLLFVSVVSGIDFDVQKYGAKTNYDITQALANAWKDACASLSPSRVIIPVGIYKLTEAKLIGPCKAPIELNVQATLQSLAGPNEGDSWITLEQIDKLVLCGGGTFDGQGGIDWVKPGVCEKTQYCKNIPVNFRLNFISNSTIQHVTSLNSKAFHVNVLGCNNITFQNFTIIAPADSPNTDGIHIGRSTKINVTESNIGTGDDCVSMGDGSREISITKVTCGPGHGISVGSLGKYQNEEPVQGINVMNCTLKNTQNGIRVKSWPASYSGIVSDLHFEDIIMDNASNPIVIDQEYCPWNQCKLETPSKVKISNVSIKKIRGTSSTPMAVQLVCSQEVPCEQVSLTDIDLTYDGNEGPITSECKNVMPTIIGKQNPSSCATNS